MLQTRSTYRQKGRSGGIPLWSTPCWSLCLDWWFRPDKNFGPDGARVLFYATSARTQHHFPSWQSNFIHLHYRDDSPPSCPWMVPPTSLHLPIHLSGCLLQTPSPPSPSWTIPKTSLPQMLCGQSGPQSLPIWFGPTVLRLDPWPLQNMSQWGRGTAS